MCHLKKYNEIFLINFIEKIYKKMRKFQNLMIKRNKNIKKDQMIGGEKIKIKKNKLYNTNIKT